MSTLYEPQTTRLERLLSINEVAATLGISRATVYRLVSAGDLAPIRVGAHARFSPADIRAYIDRHREPPDFPESAEPAVAGSKARRDLNHDRAYHRSSSSG
jgi:excisionase family DNA binding protein